MRNIEVNPNGTKFNRNRQYLRYADDIVILGTSVRVVKKATTQLKESAFKTRLSMNEAKN